MITGSTTIAALKQDWDIVIIGAGPAGAFAANLLSGADRRVLLIDKATFPRQKVCGCCINAAAISLLKAHGLGEIIDTLGGIPLKSLELHEGSGRVNVALPGGISLSRSSLDTALVSASIIKGVTFLPGVLAQVEAQVEAPVMLQVESPSEAPAESLIKDPSSNAANHALRSITLLSDGTKLTITSRVILVADGLSGRALELLPQFDCIAEPQSRFGCGTIIDDAPDFYQPGYIYMACTDNGYAGLVRLEDGRVDVAAAMDLNYSRAQGGASRAVMQILKDSHLPVPPSLAQVQWGGTEPLTRKRKCIAANGIFVIGDACGYAEPFTGEGIAWALTSAATVTSIVKEALTKWQPSLSDKWQRRHRQMMRPRHKRCQLIGQGLRRRYVRRVALPLLTVLPNIAAAIVKQIVKPIE
ncbi:MAG: FAD-dependent monooxygenase [Candidatus Obscuribacter sp.]|nr:FAD-dependent monooxygenase [Candidatus Obscuribacter sp.]